MIKKFTRNYSNIIMSAALGFLLGTQEHVRNSRGKRAIGIRAIKVLLLFKSVLFRLALVSSLSFLSYTRINNVCLYQVLSATHAWVGSLLNNPHTLGYKWAERKLAPDSHIYNQVAKTAPYKQAAGRWLVCTTVHHLKHRPQLAHPEKKGKYFHNYKSSIPNNMCRKQI